MTSKTRPLSVAAFGMVIALMCGCGSQQELHSVRGTVTRSDGAPLAQARVTFECGDPPLSSTARTNERGEYDLGTYRVGDGAPAGSHRVAVAEWLGDDLDHPHPRTIDPKYARLHTSGLQYTVIPGDNQIDIEVSQGID